MTSPLTWIQAQAQVGYKFPVECVGPPYGLGPLSKPQAMRRAIENFQFSHSHPKCCPRVPGTKYGEYPPLNKQSGYPEFLKEFQAQFPGVDPLRLWLDPLFWL